MPDVFVFGSNLAGKHGKGAALWAKKNRGAIQFQGEGLQGDSYAIPTKDAELNVLTLKEIRKHVDTFIRFAGEHPELTFELTPIGCGLAGYKPVQISPMFLGAPSTVRFPKEFTEIIGR